MTTTFTRPNLLQIYFYLKADQLTEVRQMKNGAWLVRFRRNGGNCCTFISEKAFNHLTLKALSNSVMDLFKGIIAEVKGYTVAWSRHNTPTTPTIDVWQMAEKGNIRCAEVVLHVYEGNVSVVLGKAVRPLKRFNLADCLKSICLIAMTRELKAA